MVWTRLISVVQRTYGRLTSSNTTKLELTTYQAALPNPNVGMKFEGLDCLGMYLGQCDRLKTVQEFCIREKGNLMSFYCNRSYRPKVVLK